MEMICCEGSEGRRSSSHAALRKHVYSLPASWAGADRQQGFSPEGSALPWKRHRSIASLRLHSPCGSAADLEAAAPTQPVWGCSRGRLKFTALLLLHNWFMKQIEGEENEQVNVVSLLSKMDCQLQHNLRARMQFNDATVH